MNFRESGTSDSPISRLSNKIWENEIVLDGDITIDRESTLRLSPGTRIKFLLSAGISAPKISVFGRLISEGTKEIPVLIESEGIWEGIKIEEGGEVNFSHTQIKNANTAARLLSSSSRLRMAHCQIDGGDSAIVAEAGNVTLEDLSLSAQRGTAIELKGENHFLNRIRIERALEGLCIASGSATVTELKSHCLKKAVVIRHEGRLDWSGGSAEGGEYGIHLDGGSAFLKGISISNSIQGLRLDKGFFAGHDLRFSANRDIDIALAAGTQARLNLCQFKTGKTAILASGASIEISDSEFLNYRTAIYAFDRSYLSLQKCLIENAEEAFISDGGHIHFLDRIMLKNCGRNSLSFKRGTTVCFKEIKEEFNLLNLFPPPLQPVQIPISHRILKYRFLSIQELAQRFVIQTRDLRFFRSLYFKMYSFLEGRISAWARHDNAIATAFIHRSGAASEWEPGISDLDAVVIAHDLAGEKGALWLKKLWNQHKKWRRIFPFLGEFLVAELRDLNFFFQYGGMRSREIGLNHKLIAGEKISPSPFLMDSKEMGPKALSECSHAYTQIMHCLFSRGNQPQAVIERHLFKAIVDLLKYSNLALKQESHILIGMNRRQVLEYLPKLNLAEWKENLKPLLENRDSNQIREKRLLALSLDALRYFHKTALEIGAPWEQEREDSPEVYIAPNRHSGESRNPTERYREDVPFPKSAGKRPDKHVTSGPRLTDCQGDGKNISEYRQIMPHFEREKMDEELVEQKTNQVKNLLSFFGPWLQGAVLDDLYRSDIIFNDSFISDPSLFERFSEYCRWRQLSPDRQTMPLILTRQLSTLFSQLSYLESPFSFLELGIGKREPRGALLKAGHYLPKYSKFFCGNVFTSKPVNSSWLSAQIAEATASLKMNWRWLGSKACPLSKDYVFHYLLTRTLGLRLAHIGLIAASFFDLDGLIEICKKELPECVPPAELLDKVSKTKNRQEAFFSLYPFIDAQLRLISR